MSYDRSTSVEISRQLETMKFTNKAFTEPKSEQSETWDTDFGAEESTFAQESRTVTETNSPVVGCSLPYPNEILDSGTPSENRKKGGN